MHPGRIFCAATLCVAVGVLGLAGCASQTKPAVAGSSSHAQPVASFGTADKDRTVTIHQGQPVRVTLDTTNWRFDPTADSSVIRWQPQAVASGSGGCTVINQCGSVSIAGVAIGAGQATVRATREKCGELRLCDASAGTYTLTIVVIA